MRASRGSGVFNLPNKPGGALEKVLGKIYEVRKEPGEDIEAVLSRIAIPISDVKQMFRDKALADAEVVEGEEAVVEGQELTEKELQALKDKMDLYGLDNLSDEERKIIEAHREFFFPRMKAKVAQTEGMGRKDVENILKGIGVENSFSLRIVQFERPRQVVTIKNWRPNPKAKEIEDAFRGTGVIVDFEPAEGTAFVSSAGHWDCPNHPEQEEFVVYPPIGADKGGNLVYAELGVIVGRYGKATNRWEDGTAGVQPHIAEAADEEESAYCTECGAEALWVRAPVVAQDFVPVPFDQAMIELYQAATPSIPNIVEYLKTLPEGEMLDPNDYTIPVEAYERIHEKYEDSIPVGTWTLLMINKGPKILGRRRVGQPQGETHSCTVCGKPVTINPYGYSPPVSPQPIQDTGLWRDPDEYVDYAGGYVCVEDIPKLNWSGEDWATIEHDWGIQRPAAVAQAEEEEKEEEPEEPEKEIVSCLRCENFNEETQKCNLQEKEDIDNIIAFVLQNGCNLFEAKEEYEEAPPEGEKMEEEKVVKQELPYQAQLDSRYTVQEPTISEMGVCYTVVDNVKNIFVGSAFPEIGVVRWSGEWGERREITGLGDDKDVLLRRLVQDYEGEAGKVARLIRNTVAPGLLDPDVLTEEWAQNRILDIMAERFPRISHPVVRQALTQILESWQFLRKPYFLSKGKSLISGKERVTPAPDPPGFEDRLGGFTVRTGRSGRSTMLRRIGSPGRKAQWAPIEALWEEWEQWFLENLEEVGATSPLFSFEDKKDVCRHWLTSVKAMPPGEADKIMMTWFEDVTLAQRKKALQGDPLRCKICGKPIKEDTEGDERYCQGHTIWETGTRSQQEPDPIANALYQEYLAFVRSGVMFFPDELDSARHFLINVKGLDPSEAERVIRIWYGGDPGQGSPVTGQEEA